MLQLHGQVGLRQAAQLPQNRVGRLKAEGAPRVSLADIAQRRQRPRADGQAQAVAGPQAALAAQHSLPHAEKARILAAADAAAGDIRQIPPMYSAIKKEGKKLYELARRGQEVERQPRPITIYELELLDQLSPTDYTLRVKCSKGTYVRTLCHDIGQALGCGGTLFSLRRTQSAGFALDRAVTLEQVQAAADPAALLLPVDAYFAGHPALTLTSQRAEKKVRNGNTLSLEAPDGVYRVYGPAGDFLALSRLTQGVLTTIKSFFEV